jgi:uncharacterized membrane protein YbaN (DUF454 family)
LFVRSSPRLLRKIVSKRILSVMSRDFNTTIHGWTGQEQ